MYQNRVIRKIDANERRPSGNFLSQQTKPLTKIFKRRRKLRNLRIKNEDRETFRWWEFCSVIKGKRTFLQSNPAENPRRCPVAILRNKICFRVSNEARYSQLTLLHYRYYLHYITLRYPVDSRTLFKKKQCYQNEVNQVCYKSP